jgi:protocatechuate 3,4-dioxygenase beta subunit
MRGRRFLFPLLAVGALLGALAVLSLRRPSPPAPRPAVEAPPFRELPIRIEPTAPAPTRDAQPATFEGRVIDAETRAGVAGAELTFSRGGIAASVRADARGAFLFRPPGAERGRWQLAAVTGEGHLPFAPEWGTSPVQLDAVPGRHVRGIEIYLTPAALLLGRVLDEDRQPVPGAEVRLVGARGKPALVAIPDRFITDREGLFRAAAPEGAVLEARKPGYYPGRVTVDGAVLLDGRVDLQLGPAWRDPAAGGATLHGRVTAGGRPVPGALVELARQRGFSGATPLAQTTTGADGGFTFGELADAPHALVARAEGHRPATASRIFPGAREVALELEPGGRLRGCVRSAATGAPVAPFTLQVFEATPKQNLDVPDRTLSVIDPSGCWALDDLTPGPTRIVVSAPGYAPRNDLAADVPAPPGEAEADAALEPGGALGGVVLDEAGRPVPGARVHATEAGLQVRWWSIPRPTIEAVTDDAGRFRLTGLPERVNVTAVAAGYAVQPLGGREVPPTAEAGPLEIRLRRLEPGEATPAPLAGIGAVLAPEAEALAVVAVRPGSSAAAAGLSPGDQIVEIDERTIAELGAGGAAEAIRGPVGTPLFLQVRRGNAVSAFEVTRRPAPAER